MLDMTINFIHGNCKGRSELCSLFLTENFRKIPQMVQMKIRTLSSSLEAHRRNILSFHHISDLFFCYARKTAEPGCV